MTQKQLEKDLLKKSGSLWGFNVEILGEIKARRSMNDLLEHYKNDGVTELMLMQAFKNLEFRARYCPTPRRVVFWKGHCPPEDKFWYDSDFRTDAFNREKVLEELNFGKFTPTYLEELYAKCK